MQSPLFFQFFNRIFQLLRSIISYLLIYLFLLTGSSGCVVSKLNNLPSLLFIFSLSNSTVPTTTPASSAKDITAFNFATPAATGVITGNSIALTVPFGTDITALTPTITITGQTVSPASGVVQNFSSPVAYTVTAADASTNIYTVTLTVVSSSAKDITAFNFATPAATGVITGNSIAISLPFGTDITALTPSLTITGQSVSPASGVVQNFTSPVAYTVTAADASTNVYTVTVMVAANTAKLITAFNFAAPAATGVITGNNIALTVPFGTDITALTPSLTITGQSVSPASGVIQNFTSPVAYTVTAADASTNVYTVTVTVAANTAKLITAFAFAAPAATGVITGNNIALTVPFGTDITALTPTVTITGQSVSPASGAAQNFTSPVSYTVTAADASINIYTVTVTVAANTAKLITAFAFAAPAATGVITGNNIALTVPFGTDITALTPTVTITGQSVSPASGAAQNFTSPVSYTVTAADASTNIYTVTVTVSANPAKLITAFTFAAPLATGVITGNNIAITVPYGTVITALTPTVTITGQSVSPASGSAQNFTSPVSYTVTAADASTNVYTVTVTVLAAATVNGSFVSGTVANVGVASTAILGTPVDLTKSFVYCGFQIQNSSAFVSPTCQLSNSTTIEIKTGVASTSVANWFLVEFASGVSVQRGSATFANIDLIKDIPITTIDQTKTFVLAYSRTTDALTTTDESRTVKASFTSNSNLRVERLVSGIPVTVEWQVVEFINSSVQSGISTINAASNSTTAPISAVNLSKSFLFFSYTGGAGIAGVETDLFTRGTLSNSTTVSFNRTGTNGTVDIAWFAIEMPEVNVQRGSSVMSGGGGVSVNANLGLAVNTAKTMILWSNDTQTGNAAASTTDSGTYSSQFINSTTIQFSRFNDELNTANIDWFTIEFQ